jgi:hypothetical protein
VNIVQLSAVPSQTISIALGGQAVQINLYQLGAGAVAAMYMDLISNGVQILTCRKIKAYVNLPNTRAPFMLAGRRYLGFQGDFMFLDTQASTSQLEIAPQFSGFGVDGRWQLMYLSVVDLQAAGLDE